MMYQRIIHRPPKTYIPPIEDYNCAGFAFKTFEWERLWTVADLDYAYKICKAAREINPNLSTLDCHNIEIKALVKDTIEQVEFHFKGYKHFILNNINEAPVGTIAMRISHNPIQSDFHFARKEMIDGETCWLHKQGRQPIDMMFDEDIIAPEWEGGYDSEVIYFIKEV